MKLHSPLLLLTSFVVVANSRLNQLTDLDSIAIKVPRSSDNAANMTEVMPSSFEVPRKMVTASCPRLGANYYFGSPVHQIDSTSSDMHVGLIVSLSSNGKRVASLKQVVGGAGVVQVWKRPRRGAWKQIGGNVNVCGALGDEWWIIPSKMISLSGDGQTLVVASPHCLPGQEKGLVNIYRYKQLSGWVPIDPSPLITFDSPRFEVSVAVSGDGNLIVLGTDGRTNPDGYVQVYHGTSIGAWCQVGTDIRAEDPASMWDFGRVVEMNKWGDTIAVGYNKILSDGTVAGSTRFYRFAGIDWVRLGSNEVDAGYVSLSYNGRIALVGRTIARYNDGTGIWDETVLMNKFVLPTHTATLSGDGTRAVVADTLRKHNRGKIEVFEYDDTKWCAILQKTGRDDFVNYGLGVSISGDGKYLAIGAPYKQYYHDDSYFEVYKIKPK